MNKNEIYDSVDKNDEFEEELRPRSIDEFIGQEDIREMLTIYVKAALKREEALDHILLYGPPGLGKTTLAQIVANELGTNIKTTSGPAIEKSGDLAAILSQLNPGDVLFIDEIHRIPRYIEEILYSAMEDYVLDIIIGQESEARSIRIDLPPFTLVGATTRFGDLTAPLRDRFGVVFRLAYYSEDELNKIVLRTGSVYNTLIDNEASYELAKRSRGTPRIVNRLFRRVRDFAEVIGDGNVDLKITNYALDKLGITKDGLDLSDMLYINTLIEKFNGGPVGVESLATSIGEEVTTLEDVYEPYLIKEGYIKRTARGRVALEKAYLATNKKYYNEGFLK